MNIVIPEGFTREELIACVEREIRMRERVYGAAPTFAQTRELARMGAVLAVMRQLPAEPEVQGALFGARRPDHGW